MLKMPAIGGPDHLRLLLDDVPRSRHAELLGVTDRTLRRWLAPGGRPPAAALQALFWHTRWGDSVIRSEYGFSEQLGALGRPGARPGRTGAANLAGPRLALVVKPG